MERQTKYNKKWKIETRRNEEVRLQAQLLNEESKRLEQFAHSFFETKVVTVVNYEKLYEYFNQLPNNDKTFKEIRKNGFDLIGNSILEQLKSRPSISSIEKEIGCPKNMIHVILSQEGRGIPDKYLESLIAEVGKYGY